MCHSFAQQTAPARHPYAMICLILLVALLQVSCGNQSEAEAVKPVQQTIPSSDPSLPQTGQSRAELEMRGPLTTMYRVPQRLKKSSTALSITIFIPEDAPNDLQVSLWIADDEGMWFKHHYDKPLTPGVHRIEISLDSPFWIAEPSQHVYDHYKRQLCQQWGLSFSTVTKSNHQIKIMDWQQIQLKPVPAPIQIENLVINHDQITVMDLWECSFKLSHMPKNPYRYHLGHAEIEFKHIEEEFSETCEAFYHQKMSLHDRGNKEEAQFKGPGLFSVRYCPRKAGHYRIQLRCHFPELSFEHTVDLGVMSVIGQNKDPYIRADEEQIYFASGEQEFFFPIGLNINCVHDKRGARRTFSSNTPQRGWHAYKNYLERLAAAGGNCTEIWLSSWNLGLEWHDRWAGYHGLDGFNEANAQRLEHIIQLCEKLGVHIIAVANNHGQASLVADHEWRNNPLSTRTGGPIKHPLDVFSEESSFKYYDDYHRYLQARYGHSPAILMWKLFSETDLTQTGHYWRRHKDNKYIDALCHWHQRAASNWHQRDPYNHLITTHWSTNFKWVEPQLAQQPDLDCLPVNAYHSPKLLPDMLGDMVSATIDDTAQGLRIYNKPILITEFGGDWRAAPIPQLDAEIRSGPWYGIVCQLANAPMTWWFEWVDQHDAWHAIQAVQLFVANEDLRQYDLGSHWIPTDNRCWAKGLFSGQNGLLYIVDRHWGRFGGAAPLLEQITLKIPAFLKPGPYIVEWWDPNSGNIMHQSQQHIDPQKPLLVPPFRRHLAIKLKSLKPP